MDLRDQIAIAALQGLLANPNNWMVESEVLASAAYKHANAMVVERESGSVDSVESIKQHLIKAIKEQHNMDIGDLPLTAGHLVRILQTGTFLGFK